jgi:hypothetical protein
MRCPHQQHRHRTESARRGFGVGGRRNHLDGKRASSLTAGQSYVLPPRAGRLREGITAPTGKRWGRNHRDGMRNSAPGLGPSLALRTLIAVAPRSRVAVGPQGAIWPYGPCGAGTDHNRGMGVCSSPVRFAQPSGERLTDAGDAGLAVVGTALLAETRASPAGVALPYGEPVRVAHACCTFGF